MWSRALILCGPHETFSGNLDVPTKEVDEHRDVPMPERTVSDRSVFPDTHSECSDTDEDVQNNQERDCRKHMVPNEPHDFHRRVSKYSVFFIDKLYHRIPLFEGEQLKRTQSRKHY